MAEQLEATATWRGGWATDVRSRGHNVRVDEPQDAGGEDSGFMPTELLCAALASCFCLAVAFAASKRGIELSGLHVVVRTTRAGRELRYERFMIETRAELDDATLAMLVERARPFCWVSNTLVDRVTLEYARTSLEPRFRK